MSKLDIFVFKLGIRHTGWSIINKTRIYNIYGEGCWESKYVKKLSTIFQGHYFAGNVDCVDDTIQ